MRARAKAPSGAAAPRRAPVPGRRQEITALVLLGAGIFLFFVLLAGDSAGAAGRGAGTGLTFLFGNLAFLVPLALFALAVTTALDIKVWRSYWLLGAGLLLFGLFLLTAAGFPPFGSHGEDTFVRSEYEARAGALGEVFYALFYGLLGTAGVAIVGWVTLLAGFSLATGLTVRRLGRGTKKAADAVMAQAERSTLVIRGREAQAARAAGSVGAGSRSPDGFEDLVAGGTVAAATLAGAPHLGPRDLVGGGDFDDAAYATTRGAGSPRAGGEPAFSGPFVGEFDEWSDGRTVARSPLAPLTSGGAGLPGGTRGLVDGAQAFADLYGEGGGSAAGTTAASAAAGSAAVAAAQATASTGTRPAAAESSDGRPLGRSADGWAEEGDREDAEVQQEPLPGLARVPKQIALPVEEPAYLLPEPDLLRKSTPAAVGGHDGERDTAAVLLQALAQFGVEARVIGMVVGPRVTRYELQLAPGTKVSRVTNLKDDLAYALASTEIRILAPIPGKSAVGVEVPNQRPDFVTLGDIYREFPKTAGPLMVWLGKDISGKAVYTDLTRLPHLLIAGTTGSGKSGCVNCLVSSILLRSTPEQVRFIMIDPKKVELSHYDRIPHLLVPVVTNMKDAAGVLHNVAKEMEDRYELMELEHARNLAEMNKSRARRGERSLPYIVIVIDELADLMMVSPQEVEEYVIRLAQKSRAVGIHLVVATQRPSADVITGMIKANIPSRIAFAVSSQTDSRVILDVNGAETLLGMGDMLFKPLGASHLQRVQGAYITEEEIAVLVTHWRQQAEPEFREELLRRPPDPKKGGGGIDDLFDPDSDELLRRRRPAGHRDGERIGLHAAEAAACGLYAGGAPHRHAGEARHRGALGGQQAAADHGGGGRARPRARRARSRGRGRRRDGR